MIVGENGASVFSETTECIPGEPYLLGRCKDDRTKNKLKREFEWYKKYLKNGGANHSANTTPGNLKGGISSIIEKSLGSISKSGQ
jgi:galactarate dehydratase